MRTLIFTFTTFLRFCSQSCELMVSLSNSNLPMPSKILPAESEVITGQMKFQCQWMSFWNWIKLNSTSTKKLPPTTKMVTWSDIVSFLEKWIFQEGHVCPPNSVNHHLSLKILIPIEIYLQKWSFITFQSK